MMTAVSARVHRYEDLVRVDKLSPVVAAESTLHGGWEYKDRAPLRLDAISWGLDSTAERSWIQRLQSWDFLDSLLKAHSETGNERYLRAALPASLDWVQHHKDQSLLQSPNVWSAQTAGVRSYRLAYMMEAGEAAGALDDGERSSLWEALEQHRTYLADDANIIFTNHAGFYQAAGQLAIGRRFAHVAQNMAEARTQGHQRLLQMLQTQFAADGLHREHSPAYHRTVYEFLKAILDAKLVDDPRILNFADTIERALSWLVLPNRHLANFGDTDYRMVAQKPTEAVFKWRTPEMQYVVSNGVVGASAAEECKAFPEGGAFVVRKFPQGPHAGFGQASYLAQTAAFHSRAHKHADDLSFIWSDRGTDILVDAGRYGFLGKTEEGSALWQDGYRFSDPNRVYCESTAAHNTLEFDGQNYKRKGIRPFGSALKRWQQTENGVFAVETECRQLGTIRHSRVLALLPARWLLVFDWYHDNTDQPRTATQWFHLSRDLGLLKDSEGPLVMLPNSDQPLRVIPLLSGAGPMQSCLGQELPTMQGWWSPREKEIVPAYAFSFQQTGAPTGSFATLFGFANTIKPDLDWSVASGSGRKAKLRWSDENDGHVLVLDRPVSGEFKVTYKQDSSKRVRPAKNKPPGS